jgi:uncharacterized protein YxjI
MKKLVVFLFVMIALKSSGQSNSEMQASGIATRMRDTLQLTDSQHARIYRINMDIIQQKSSLRIQYASNDSLRIKIQQVENTRDGLYSVILSNDKYLLYLQKKRFLLNGN